MKQVLIFCIIILFSMIAFAQHEMPLYPGPIPNSIAGPNEESSEINSDSVLIVSKISIPTLTAFIPPAGKSNGTAVIICPGGGYGIVAAGHEGADVARRFNEMGVAAFVLKYRIPTDQIMPDKEIGPLQDAQQAISVVRANAKKWGIHKDRIGLMGFSAGGHLASTAGTHFTKDYRIGGGRRVRNNSLRPDFLILVYPVISFSDSIGHVGSRTNLLGKEPAPEKIAEYSNELQVTPQTPPTFLVHAKDDPVKVENSLAFEAALKKNKVPVELFLYESGGHGYGMYNKDSPVRWMDLVEKWLPGLFKSK